MAGLNDLLAYIDQKKRTFGRNLSDLVENPNAVGEQWNDQFREDLPKMVAEPANYIPGGFGLSTQSQFVDKLGRTVRAPFQAELAYRLNQNPAIRPETAQQVYRMGGAAKADPELLKLIDEEAFDLYKSGRGR